MKRLISLLLTCAMLLGMTATSAALSIKVPEPELEAVAPCVVLNCKNCGENITEVDHALAITDVLTILKYMVNLIQLTPCQIKLYDFFGTGIISADNALEILKDLVGMVSAASRPVTGNIEFTADIKRTYAMSFYCEEDSLFAVTDPIALEALGVKMGLAGPNAHTCWRGCCPSEYQRIKDAAYDAFQNGKYVVVVTITNTSGSDGVNVDSIDSQGKITVTRSIACTGTADMATWNAIITVDRTVSPNFTLVTERKWAGCSWADCNICTVQFCDQCGEIQCRCYLVLGCAVCGHCDCMCPFFCKDCKGFDCGGIFDCKNCGGVHCSRLLCHPRPPICNCGIPECIGLFDCKNCGGVHCSMLRCHPRPPFCEICQAWDCPQPCNNCGGNHCKMLFCHPKQPFCVICDRRDCVCIADTCRLCGLQPGIDCIRHPWNDFFWKWNRNPHDGVVAVVVVREIVEKITPWGEARYYVNGFDKAYYEVAPELAKLLIVNREYSFQLAKGFVVDYVAGAKGVSYCEPKPIDLPGCFACGKSSPCPRRSECGTSVCIPCKCCKPIDSEVPFVGVAHSMLNGMRPSLIPSITPRGGSEVVILRSAPEFLEYFPQSSYHDYFQLGFFSRSALVVVNVEKSYASGAVIVDGLRIENGILIADLIEGIPCCMGLRAVTGRDLILLSVPAELVADVKGTDFTGKQIFSFHMTAHICNGETFNTWFRNWLISKGFPLVVNPQDCTASNPCKKDDCTICSVVVTEVSFVGMFHSMINGTLRTPYMPAATPSGGCEVVLIRNVAEFAKYFQPAEGTITPPTGFPNDEFFKENAIVVANVGKGYASGAVIVDGLRIEGGILIADLTYGTPCCVAMPAVTGRDLILLSVSAELVADVKGTDFTREHIRSFHVTDHDCGGSTFYIWFRNWLVANGFPTAHVTNGVQDWNLISCGDCCNSGSCGKADCAGGSIATSGPYMGICSCGCTGVNRAA